MTTLTVVVCAALPVVVVAVARWRRWRMTVPLALALLACGVLLGSATGWDRSTDQLIQRVDTSYAHAHPTATRSTR